MDIETIIQYRFKNPELLKLALTHKSFHFETRDKNTTGHNEKLEFLGDAVVDLALSSILMRKFPNDDEGQLSKKRASLVNESVLAKLAQEIGLSQFLILGKGEASSGGAQKPRLLASTFEALAGALFLDAGFDMVLRYLEHNFSKMIDEFDPSNDFAEDFKTRLQELVQGEFKTAPAYKVISEAGPSHDRRFEVEVSFSDRILGKGTGRSKKAAEQEAAREALNVWKLRQEAQ